MAWPLRDRGLHKCGRCLALTRGITHPTLGRICAICFKPLATAPPLPLSKKERRQGKRYSTREERELVARLRAKEGRPPPRRVKSNPTPSLRERVYARDGHRCVECGWSPRDSRRHPGRKLTLDHKVPRSRGGPNTYENLQTMCGPCNHAKGDRTPEEWEIEKRERPKRDRAASIAYREAHGQRPRKELQAA